MAERTERPLEQLSDADLFAAATADPTPAPEPVVDMPRPVAPAAAEPPAPEPTPTPEPTPPPAPQPETEAAIPSWRLREETERARMAEERAGALEARLREIATHLQQNGKQAPSDFFDDPNKATQDAIIRTLAPYAEETRKTLMHLGKMVASNVHGAGKVEEAEQAFLAARDNQTLDPVDYERVVQSPNRYDAVVQWHKRQSVLSSVGDDPVAWFEKQLEARLDDPQFQAKFLERVQKGAATRATTTQLPPSLSRSTAVATSVPRTPGDLSDASLFAYATGKLERSQ